jgi:uncharacterized small protein (DUF1192 family)
LKETNAAVAKKPSIDLMVEEKNQQQQQQKTRQGDVTVVKIEAAIKALDHNIERLEAKLSFLIKSYDDPRTDLSDQYEKKIDTVKKEIEHAMEERRRLNR